MLKIFTETLDQDRKDLLPLLTKLPKGGVLNGGTALALQIGHRKSYDFDFFYNKPIPKNALLNLRKLFGSNLSRAMVDNPDELTVIIKKDIKLTLLHYPFTYLHKRIIWKGIKLAAIQDIASAKAYAVGRRGVWRDYVDLYFILRDHLTLSNIINASEKRYQGVFDARLFLEQLTYYEDLEDMTIEYTSKPISEKLIKDFLNKSVEDYLKKQKII